MSLAKKGARLITVDGVSYRWRVRDKPTYCQGSVFTPLTFAVEQADPPGATLVVKTQQAHPSNWMGEPAVPVRPAHVVAAIRMALVGGWQPAQSRPVFYLDLDLTGPSPV